MRLAISGVLTHTASLVAISETDLDTGRLLPAAIQNVIDRRPRQDVFHELGASFSSPMLVTADERPERLRVHRISSYSCFNAAAGSMSVARLAGT